MVSGRCGGRGRIRRAGLHLGALLGLFACSALASPLTLPELIAKARSADPRVRAAQAKVAELRGKYKEAYWAWFPQFSTTVLFGGPTPEARNDGLGGPPTTAASYMYDANLGTLGFTVGTQITALLPVYTFGKLSALRKAGEQGVVIGQALQERTEAEVSQQVVEAFYGYQLAREGQATLTRDLQRVEDAGGRIQELLDKQSSQVSLIDQFKVTYYKNLLLAHLAEAKKGMAVAVEALRLLTGTPEDQPLDLASRDLAPPDFALQEVKDYLDEAARNRPELRAIRAGIIAQQQAVLIRQRQYFPDFGLLGFFNFEYTSSATRQRSPFAYDPYNTLSSGVALVAQVTFDLPQKAARVDQEKAKLDELEAQQELLEKAIRLQVTKIRAELVEAKERSKTWGKAEKSASHWATSAVENFELGVGDTRELVDAFVAEGQAAAEKLKAWYDAQLGLWELAQAIGQPSPVVKTSPGQ